MTATGISQPLIGTKGSGVIGVERILSGSMSGE